MPNQVLSFVRDDTRPSPGAGSVAGDSPLHDSAELQALLIRGLRAIISLTGAGGGAIRLFTSADPPTMRLVASVGMPPEWVRREQAMATDCGICGSALQSNCTQVDSQAAYCGPRMGPYAGDSLHGPALAVPLHCQGRPIGVFNLFFGREGRVPEDLSSLVAPVGEMLDLVLDNAMLQQEQVRATAATERQMMAAEVHDSLAQGLAYMRMRMSLLQDAMRTGDRKRALRYFEDVNGALCEAHGRLRSLITHSRQGMDQGLLATLRSTAASFHHRTGVSMRLESEVEELDLAPEQEVQVLHIVQEALSNVIKHAGAREVRVVVNRSARRLQISVEDDGVGVAQTASAADGHYGLEIMRERAERIGGNLEIRSAPRKGTRVRLVIPATQSAAQP